MTVAPSLTFFYVVLRGGKIYKAILNILFIFYLYIYPPDSQESDGGANI